MNNKSLWEEISCIVCVFTDNMAMVSIVIVEVYGTKWGAIKAFANVNG